MTKSWEYWSIELTPEEYDYITISGNSSSLDKVSITSSGGNVIDAREYIITYNDGEICVSKPYTVEAKGLNYFAKITNNTSSPINVTAIGFDVSGGDEEEFHNTQVVVANSTAYYNDGNPICLVSCDNTYTTASISNFYIEIDDVTHTVTCDKTIIGDGDTITLTYNG